MDLQLLRQSSSNNLSNEKIKTGVSREMILQKQFILVFGLEDNKNASVYVFITEIITNF